MADDTWTVLLPAEIDPAGPDSIADIAEFVSPDDYSDREALLADAGRFDAVIVRVAEIDDEFIDRATALEVISKHGVGLDNVDIPAATERGIVVCNTPGTNTRAVAEHAIALLLAARRRLLVADRHVRGGGWDRGSFVFPEVGGTTLGLYGVGAIGSTVAGFAQGLGMDVVAYDPYVAQADAPAGVTMVDDITTLCDRVDAVSVHAPLTAETRGAIDADTLARLGADGLVVNTSRGGIVDEEALVAAIRAGEIAGAGLDVFEEEPPDTADALFDLDAVILTPHVAGGSVEAMRAMSLDAAANVRTVYEGGLPEATVNRDGLAR